MTATVRNLPDMTARMDRITARQRAANIAAEGQPVNVYTDPRVTDELARYENYRTAKAVLTSPRWYSADVVHDALAFVHEYERTVPARRKVQPADNRARYGKPLAAIGLVYVSAMVVIVALRWAFGL